MLITTACPNKTLSRIQFTILLLKIFNCQVLLDAVSNFPNSCEEISVSVSPSAVKIKNFVDDESDPMKVVHTEMTLVPEEFDDFSIGKPLLLLSI